MNEYYYTVSEASEILEVSERTVLNWIHNEKLKAEKIGKTWRIYTDIRKFVNGIDSRNDTEKNETISENTESDPQKIWLWKQIEILQEQNAELLRQLDESKMRADTIIAQLTQQNTKLIEDMSGKSIWKRLKTAFGFASS